MRIFDYITNKGSLYSETGVLGVITGGLLYTKCNKGWYLPCTGSKYITFTLPSLQQKAIITVTKVNNNYVVTQTNTTATITSLILNNANYLRYVIYDTVASATSDLKNIQSWVNTLQPLTYQKRQLQLAKPTELKQQGLIAAYNMKPVGNVLHDINGNGKNITVPVGGYISTTKGLMSVNKNASGTTNNLTASSVTATDFTYCLSHDGMIFPTGATIFKKVKYIGYGSTNLQYFEGSLQNFTPNIPIALLNKNGTIIFTYNNSSKLLSVYINGVLSGTATFATAIGAGSFDAIFNASDIGGKQINGVIKDIRIYNRVLTSQEIKAYHNSFNEVILHEKFEDMAVGSSKLPNGWIKNGGSFVCEEHYKKRGEVSPNVSFESNSNGWSGGNMNIVWNVSKDITCTATNASDTRILTSSAILTTGRRFRLMFNAKSSNSTVKLNIPNSYGYYSSPIVINNPNLNNNYQQYIIEATSTNGYVYINFEVGNGKEITIDNISVVEIDPLPNFKNGTKYLRCVTSGIVAIPCKQAYGTWEFDCYKGGDTNTIDFSVVSNAIGSRATLQASYTISMHHTEAIYIFKNNSGVVATSINYITNNTLYRIRITKTTLGVNSVYILGGVYTSWTLALQYTDNTYTSSSYIVISTNANDRVGNILIQSQIKQ